MEQDVEKQMRSEREKLIVDIVKARISKQPRQAPRNWSSIARLGRRVLLACLPIFSVGVFWLSSRPKPPVEVPYGEMKQLLIKKQVRDVVVAKSAILAELDNHKIVHAQIPVSEASQFWADLVSSGASLGATQKDTWSTAKVAITCLATGIASMVGLLLSFSSWGQRLTPDLLFGKSRDKSITLSFGESRAQLLDIKAKKLKFNDFIGPENKLEPLRLLIDYMREPQKYQKLGTRAPKGTLLVGPSGSGKTHLAKVVASESNAPFFIASGTEFVEAYPGVGPSRMRDLFERGKKNAPCFLFIDQLDAIGRRRSICLDPLSLEYQITLNQLLVEMDDLAPIDGVLVLASTDRPDLLDEALMRPDRFGTVVELNYLSRDEVSSAFSLYLKKVPVASDVDIGSLASGLVAVNPRILADEVGHVVNLAAASAAAEGAKLVTMDAFVRAINKKATAQA